MRSTRCTAEYHLGMVVKSATKSNTVAGEAAMSSRSWKVIALS
jgi:hypothetical protein